MKVVLFVVTLMFSIAAGAVEPKAVVDKRMQAHNDHNLALFLSTYADDVKIYDYPDTPLGKGGKEHMKKIFAPLFAKKLVHTEVKSQLTNGNYVVNRETVMREGRRTEYISIYEVEKGLIKSVRFIK